MSLVKLLCVELFVLLLAGMNWYVYVYVQNMEPSGRCSSTYPDHGVILDNAVTLVDGSLQTEDGTVYPPGAFWVEDGVVRGCPCSIGPCVNTPFEYRFYDALIEVKWYLKIRHAFIFIPTVLHAVTFVVFLLVPRLRSGCGKAIMNYVAAQFFKKLVMICTSDYNQHFVNVLEDSVVYTGGLLVHSKSSVIQYFLDVSAHIWQLVIAFQLWGAFRPGRTSRPDITSRRITILYSALGWGVALVWTVVIYYVLRTLVTLLGPHGTTYFLIQVMDNMAFVLAEIACLVLSVCAMCELRAGKKNSEKLQESNSQRHNTIDIKWSSLFLKISLLTGIDYIFLNAFNFVGQLNTWMFFEIGTKVSISLFIRYTLSQINNLRGVEIFFIFVFKIEVFKSLAEQLRLRKKQPNANIPMQNLQQRPGPSRP